jgi:ABC-type transport system involved in multi-copper enzyme maturation permease subunit
VSRHGVRTLLKNKFIRLLLVAAWLPAIVLVAALTVWGLLEQQAESVLNFLKQILPTDVIAQPREYRTAVWTIAYSYFFRTELIVSLFLVLIIGPNLISRDLRFNAFPLYFARPLRRVDYFVGKLGVIGFFLAATVVVPAVVAYAFGLAFSLDLAVIRDTYHLLWAGLLYGLVITVSAGTLMLALSSLSRRSIYVGLMWAGFVFLTQMLAAILMGIHDESAYHTLVRDRTIQWVNDHPPPPGVEMRGPFPVRRFGPPPKDKPPPTDSEKAKEKWVKEWSAANDGFRNDHEAARLKNGFTDWRPLLSNGMNLDRLGDALLDTDRAWEILGRTVEQPRAMIGPLAKGSGVPVPTGPANDRRLADRMVWQYPWVWSAGVLTGLWLLSVFVLSQRVKSLDRLK